MVAGGAGQTARRGGTENPRLGRPSRPSWREPDSDQVEDAQHDGDRVPSRGLEGHSKILWSFRRELLASAPFKLSQKKGWTEVGRARLIGPEGGRRLAASRPSPSLGIAVARYRGMPHVSRPVDQGAVPPADVSALV